LFYFNNVNQEKQLQLLLIHNPS